MAYETVEHAPVVDDFKLLADHQAQTPGTFFGGNPVLHLHCPGSKLRIASADLASQPDFAALDGNGALDSDDGLVEVSQLDVWVNSNDLTIFSSATSKGIKILYPTISIHAQDGEAVLLELNLSHQDTPDEDLVFLQLRLVPEKIDHHTTEESDDSNGHEQNGNGTSASPVALLYNAISACQELNPDPPSDDEGPAFDETAPGATGWITSENMQDFVDENGNFRMPEGMTVMGGDDDQTASGAGSLGEGAGRTRTAAEVDGEDGVEDESKWQRTA